MQQNTLFGERTVSIPDNPTLEAQCNHILRLVDVDKTLLDGDSPGMIDRKLTWAIWLENGLKGAVAGGMDAVQTFMMDGKQAPSPETIGRARRWLVEHDQIRLSAKALKESFNQEKRLASAFRK